MKIANDKKVLEGRTNGLFSNVVGYNSIPISPVEAVIMITENQNN
jgi:hypothetical protein